MLKRFLAKFIKSLGFQTTYDAINSNRGHRESIMSFQGEIQDLENEISDLQEVYRNAAENNHRLKKLEEYLGVEYVADIPDIKSFIGYKKKKS